MSGFLNSTMKAISSFAAASSSNSDDDSSAPPKSFQEFLGTQISKTFNLPQAIFASALESEISKLPGKIESLRDIDIKQVTACWTDITASDMAELANIVGSKLFSAYERASKVIDENDFSLMDLEMLERKLGEKKAALMSQMVEEGIETGNETLNEDKNSAATKSKPKKEKPAKKAAAPKRSSDDEQQQQQTLKKKRKTAPKPPKAVTPPEEVSNVIDFVAKGEHQPDAEDINLSVNSQVFE